MRTATVNAAPCKAGTLSCLSERGCGGSQQANTDDSTALPRPHDDDAVDLLWRRASRCCAAEQEWHSTRF